MYLLLGAGGFLGYSFARFLVSKKIQFASVSRSFQWHALPYESRFIGSVSDIALYGDALAGNPNVIYMAGSPNLISAEDDPYRDLELHIKELQSFMQFLSSSVDARHFYFLSSGGTVYGDSNGVVKDELSPLMPKSAYGVRNVVLEAIVRSASITFKIPSTILRVTSPFGPGQHLFRRRGLIQVLLDSSVSGETVYIRGNGYQVRDYIYSNDLCEMIYALKSGKDIPVVINMASGYSYSAREIVQRMEENDVYPSVEYIDDSKSFEVNDSLVSPRLILGLSGKSKESLQPLARSNLMDMLGFVSN